MRVSRPADLAGLGPQTVVSRTRSEEEYGAALVNRGPQAGRGNPKGRAAGSRWTQIAGAFLAPPFRFVRLAARSVASSDGSECQLARRRTENCETTAVRGRSQVRQVIIGAARSPGYSIAVVANLSLGLGVATIAFAIFNAVVLRPLPFPNSGQLYSIESWTSLASLGVTESSERALSAWQNRATTFSSVAGYAQGNATLVLGSEAREIDGAAVTKGFFRTLGTTVASGREFLKSELRRGGGPAVIVSDHLAKVLARNSRGPVLGRRISIGRVERTVVGVMPPGFDFPGMVDEFGAVSTDDFWIPYQMHSGPLSSAPELDVVARLKSHQSASLAQAEVQALARAIPNQAAPPPGVPAARVVPLARRVVGKALEPMEFSFAGAMLLFLIAWLNTSALALARLSRRYSQLAVMMTLGSSPSTIMARIFGEGIFLSVIATGFALAASAAVLPALGSTLGTSLPEAAHVGLAAPIVGFALLVGLAASSFALVPWPAIAEPNLAHAVLSAGQRTGTGRRQVRILRMAIAVEAAFALVLVSSGLLLFRSAKAWHSAPLGFSAAKLLAVLPQAAGSLDQPGGTTDTDPDLKPLYQRLLHGLKQLPGVASVALSGGIPVSSSVTMQSVSVAGLGTAVDSAEAYVLGGGFGLLPTLGVPLIRGRYLTRADLAPGATPVALIDTVLARELSIASHPVGREVTSGGGQFTVVGEFSHFREAAPFQPDLPELIVPAAAGPGTAVMLRANFPIDLHLLRQVRRAARLAAPDIPVSVQPMRTIVRSAGIPLRSHAWVSGAVAALGLLLATLGVLGLSAFTTSLMRPNLAIRAALGATPARLILHLEREIMGPVLLGIAIGLGTAILTAVPMRAITFGVGPYDFISLLIACTGQIAAALLGILVPVWRAAQVTPSAELRHA